MAGSRSPSSPPGANPPRDAPAGALPLAEAWPAWRGRVRDAERLVLFLDFDGTLVRIAPRPEQVELTPAVRGCLERLVARPGVWVVVVSGRAEQQLARLVGLDGVHLIGSHGYEMSLPPALARLVEGARELTHRGHAELERALAAWPGAWLEAKPSGATAHFRAVDTARHGEIVERIGQWHRADPRRVQLLVLRPARAAIEIRPRAPWGKGEASRWWLETVAPRAARGAVVVTAGDDDTDEDLFRTWRPSGFTLRVGGEPAATAAAAWTEAPEAFWAWLEDVDRARSERPAAADPDAAPDRA